MIIMKKKEWKHKLPTSAMGRGDMNTYPMEILTIVTRYYELFLANQFDNLGESQIP